MSMNVNGEISICDSKIFFLCLKEIFSPSLLDIWRTPLAQKKLSSKIKYIFFYPLFFLLLQVKCLQEKAKHQDKSTRSLKLHKRKDLKVLFAEIRDLTSALCKPPYLRNTVLACAIQFGLTSSYYTLMVWFPELFTR